MWKRVCMSPRIGTLRLSNYAEDKNANLVVHPGSVIRTKVGASGLHGLLSVRGLVMYSNSTEDFMTSDKMPVIEVLVADDAELKVGDEIDVLTTACGDWPGISAGKSPEDWHFDVRANKYTWEVVENNKLAVDGPLTFSVRVVSLDSPDNPDNPVNPVNTDSTMGAFYDDGIDDAADNHTLAYYAAKNRKSVGVALATYRGYQSDRDAAGQQFNMMVCENEMKMDALQPSRGSFSFGGADQLVRLAQQHDMVIRGHCLVWHSQQPTWLSSDGKKNDKNWSRDEALDLMKYHITKVMQHYKGKVREWDVVNECLADNQTAVRSNPDGYDLRQQSVWWQAIGDDYIDSAFVYAHRADPDAQLYLNDYGVELQGKAKTTAFYNLATRLKNRGIPIDGVGLQCHFSIGDVDSVKLDNTIRRFGQAGLQCIITELDMGIPSTSDDNLLEQARNYRVVTDIMLNHDNCPSMVVWGIKDNDSWRSGSNPLLYTSGMGKKPAWYAVRSALRHRSLTETGIRTVQQTKRTDGNAYNLSGQRVAPDYRGIVIVDGKKVLNR